jgi:hypothetical protein
MKRIASRLSDFILRNFKFTAPANYLGNRRQTADGPHRRATVIG